MRIRETMLTQLDLGTKRSVGMHWGMFSLTDEPLDQPPIDLIESPKKQHMEEAVFYVMKIGETQQMPVHNP